MAQATALVDTGSELNAVINDRLRAVSDTPPVEAPKHPELPRADATLRVGHALNLLLLRLTPNAGQLVVWSGGLAGQLLFVL